MAYASRKLMPHEVRYVVVEKECWALKHFHTYLYGQEFLIKTDHRPLVWLNQMKDAKQEDDGP